MLKRVVILVCALAMSAGAFAAQAKPAPPKKPVAVEEAKPSENKTEPAAKPLPSPPPQPVNVKIEVSITDQTGSGTPARKLVTMMAADQQSTSIRSSASILVRNPQVPTSPGNYRNVTINVDARPWLVAKEPNKVLVTFGLEYMPKSAGGAEETEPGMASLNERLSLVLESGKPMIVSQAADPTSDRKITVEVTATILK
jgi:hypothetical protein